MEPANKRRRLRRGTSSCWECKRRKVRCDFASESKAVCVSCRRRGTRCILQDVPENDSSAVKEDGYRDVEKGIVRVEAMVEQLIRGPKAPPASVRTTTAQSRAPSNEKLLARRDQDVSDMAKLKSPKGKLEYPRQRKLAPLTRKGSGQVHQEDHSLGSSDSPSRQSKTALGPPSPFSLSRYVYSYLPPTPIVTQIMRRGKFRSFAMQMLRKPLMSFLKQTGAEEQTVVLESLEPTAHPVLLARRLIQLAICLQQMDPVSDASQLRLDGSAREVATRFFNAASSYVTSQDSLIVSIDGLETLMLEGHFHLNSGNYKLSWLVFRKAMDVAQLLGLHSQGLEAKSADEAGICTEYLWFRLTYINRYLSMMLSLPIATVQHDLIVAQQPQAEQALERLERIHASVMGRIVVRNERMRSGDKGGRMVHDHYEETQDIDYELRQAVRLMPTRWWAIPTIRNTDSGVLGKPETARIVLQIHQYNLLMSLHAPYVIPGVRPRAVVVGGETDYAYSKTAALSACRESLMRFPILSKSKHIPTSSRGMNFKAFISAATLLLAHIAGHQLGHINVLEHQRPGDLDMIDNVIEALDMHADRRADLADRSCARVLKTLLEFEDAAANGAQYDIWSEAPAVGQIDCTTQSIERGVEVMIPTVGTVHITRRLTEMEPIARSFGTEQSHGRSLLTIEGTEAVSRDTVSAASLAIDDVPGSNMLLGTPDQVLHINSSAKDSSGNPSSEEPLERTNYVDFSHLSPMPCLEQMRNNEQLP